MSLCAALPRAGANLLLIRQGCRALFLLPVLLLALGLAGCVAPTSDASAARAAAQARRFDRVEQVVRTRYYAPDLHGVNWSEMCNRYRPHALAASDEPTWYGVVNGMLLELRDAHTRAERPRNSSASGARVMAASAGSRPALGETRVLPGGCVVMRFDHFNPATVRWLASEVAAHRDANGLIIDLRRNRGGLVSANQRAVGLFFSSRVAMGEAVHRNGRRVVERSRSGRAPAYDGPLAVLVGPDSHSSAEVFAHVMQHHGRAVVIGLPTAGEVLGARSYRLSDGGRLYVSTSDYRGCDGRRLEGEGVAPDITIIGMTPGYEVATDPAVVAAVRAFGMGRGTASAHSR